MSYTKITTYKTTTCCHEGCGVSWGMTAAFYEMRRSDRKWFWCPNGHRQYFSGDNDSDRADREQRRAERAQRHADRLQRQLSATRGWVTRLREKAAKGECPCCSETFDDLATHMAEKHPAFVEGGSGD